MRILFIVSVVLAAASAIRRNNLDFEQAVRVLLSKGTEITLGKGNAPSDLPVVECIKPRDSAKLNCTVSLRLTDRFNDHCRFILLADRIDAVYQLSEKKLIVVWGQSRRGTYDPLVRKITTVDVENCANTVTLNFSENDLLEDVVLYVDAFDAIVAGKDGSKSIVRYDFDGRQLEKLPFDQDPSKFPRPVKDVLAYAEVKSEYEKQVTISARSSQFLTVCGQKTEHDPRRFACTQVYVPSQLKSQMEVILPENVKLIHVHDLSREGVVLFGIQGDRELIVAEMRPDRQPIIRHYKLGWPVNGEVSVIWSFNEKAASFSFAAEINEPDHAVLLQHFELPSKIYQDAKNVVDR